MAVRPVYGADRDVIEECARRGVPDITARKLERWRRFLPDRPVEHRPGLRGSRTRNPASYVDQVLALDALLKSGVSLRHVPMGLFARGFPIKPEVLRDAYASLYGEVRDRLTEGPELSNLPRADPADWTDALAIAHLDGVRSTQLGRSWTRRARRLVAEGGAGQGDDVLGLLAGVLSATFTWFLAGNTPSEGGVIEALTVAGLYDGQDPDAAADHLASMSLNAMIAAIAQAAEADWVAARRDTEELARFLELRRRIDQRWDLGDPAIDGLVDVDLEKPDVRSLLIPVALLLGDSWRRSLSEDTEKFLAVDRILEELPEKFRQFLRPDRTEELRHQPEVFRTELGSFLFRWAQNHPDDALRLFPALGGSDTATHFST